ncbi:MAG: 4Fe-4S dicluster domain-containing protein [bacterium]
MMALDLTGKQYKDTPLQEKERLFQEIKQDIRFEDFLYGCYECGICVAACPSARFYDFSPRVIAQAVAREDADLVYTLMNDSIWDCSQCFSCDRCPRKNSPGGLITVIREVAVRNGLQTARDALEGYGRIIYKIMSTGTQVSPDMLQADAFPDWGGHVQEIADNLDLWRRALPPETLHTTETGWAIDDKTIIELYLIWHMTGVMDMIKEVDEGLFMILQDVMEERLEEAGYDETFD